MIAPADLQNLLALQKRGLARRGIPDLQTRESRLDRAIALLVENQDVLCDALSKDYQQCSKHQSLLVDIFSAVSALKVVKQHLRAGVKPERFCVQASMNWLGAKAYIQYQPKGVVGVIATWNFPAWIPFGSLGSIFAAGNSCMLKLSEHTPHTSMLIEKLVGQYFDQEELVVVNGDELLGEVFSQLPFDHLYFTGTTAAGKKVMRAAAENLVPVTLKLSGKSPVIIGKNANLKKAARAIVLGKSVNVGQACLAPDYVFVKDTSLNEFIAELERAYALYFPTLLHNPDYGSVINGKHYARLLSFLDDAKSRGGEIWEINNAKENFRNQQGAYKIPPTLIINPSEDMRVMQEEIFGPLLPVKSYQHIDDAIEYINEHPRPLALTYFGHHQPEMDKVLAKTVSGGVTINDVVPHVGGDDFPFCAAEEFKIFSHARFVYQRSRINRVALAGLLPPYTESAKKKIERMIKK